jgi:hypothetical protein
MSAHSVFPVKDNFLAAVDANDYHDERASEVPECKIIEISFVVAGSNRDREWVGEGIWNFPEERSVRLGSVINLFNWNNSPSASKTTRD